MAKTPQVEALPGMTPLGFNPAQHACDKPLKPKQDQVACDIGLFSDDSLQSDLIDQLRSK